MALYKCVYYYYYYFMAFFPGPPGEPVPEEIFWTFMVQGKITGDTPTICPQTDGWCVCHSIRSNQWHTSVIPPFLCRMPFLPQPSHFILAYDRHQICWLTLPSGVVVTLVYCGQTVVLCRLDKI